MKRPVNLLGLAVSVRAHADASAWSAAEHSLPLGRLFLCIGLGGWDPPNGTQPKMRQVAQMVVLQKNLPEQALVFFFFLLKNFSSARITGFSIRSIIKAMPALRTGIHCQSQTTEITNEVHFLRMCKCPNSELNCQQLKDNTIDMYLALVTQVYFFLESCFGRQSGVRVSQVVVLTNCSGGKGRESDKISLIILN